MFRNEPGGRAAGPLGSHFFESVVTRQATIRILYHSPEDGKAPFGIMSSGFGSIGLVG